MSDTRGSVWSDWEVDAIVANYFDMLSDELSRKSYSKAEHNEALQSPIPRNRKSIEFKHCNVSAVLERLGIPYIRGYRPLPHFQKALIEAVERYLDANGQPIPDGTVTVPAVVAEAPTLWVGPSPEIEASEHKEPEALRQLVRKFDPAQRDARNRALGRQGEELAFMHEQQRLRLANRIDLAKKVEWTSEVRGDGAGYDIRSFNLDGSERLIEVKTTNGPAKTPFFLSEPERAFSEERPDAFMLLRLYDFFEKPSAFELRPPLNERLALSPTNYRASLI